MKKYWWGVIVNSKQQKAIWWRLVAKSAVEYA